MNEIKIIKKEDFLKIKEDDVYFITNPGRMGDEDGITFVVKQDDKYLMYRVNGWMYPKKDINKEDYITLNDVLKQFPKWYETWKNSNKKNYCGKYKYLYMGFGNGLCVDNRIYNDFKSYLDEEVKDYLNDYSEEEKKELKYAAIFNVWKNALIKMLNNNK